MNTSEVLVFILFSGLGVRLKEDLGFCPKPMVPIGEHPIRPPLAEMI
jgi:glucose-1-phosphate cytidylyltransferase